MSVSTVKNDLREANRLNAEGAPKSYGSTHEEKTNSRDSVYLIGSQIISKQQPSIKKPMTCRAIANTAANFVFKAALFGFIASGAVAVFASCSTAATAGSVFLALGVFLGLCHIASTCCDGNESERSRLKRDAMENHSAV